MSSPTIIDHWYAALLEDLVAAGSRIHTRNGPVRRIDTDMARFTDMPLISVRKTSWRQALREMEWFLSGSVDINDLHESVRDWWRPWADPEGLVFGGYGKQFRWCDGLLDQIEALIGDLRSDPYSRRHVVTTWNPVDLVTAPIANCHGTVIQCFVDTGVLSMTMYQRSVDVMCGLPHNLCQYWALLTWLAHRTGLTVGGFTWIGGDVHLYEAHVPLAERIITSAVGDMGAPHKLVYTPTSDEFMADDFALAGDYTPLITERAELIV